MKTKQYIGALVFSLSCLACDPLTEIPESNLTADSFYKTPADAVVGINAAYRPLNQTQGFGAILLVVNNLSSDDFYTNPAETNVANHELGQSRATSANIHLLGVWTNQYLALSRANIVLDKLPAINPGNNSTNKVLLDRVGGEAKFLRALVLFNLTRLFGDVPMPLTASTPPEQLNIARTPQAQVYAQIIKDLTEAAAVLPARYTGADIGRPTTWAAKGLLAKVYLQQKDWAQTVTLCNEIMASNTFSLWPNFTDAFNPQNKNGRESLFEVQFAGPGLSQGNIMLRYCLPRNGSLGVGFGLFFPTNDLLNAFEPNDTRRAGTFFNSYVRSNGTRVTFSPDHLRKYNDDAAIAGAYTNDANNNFPLLRYAEVLLMYAEALNETSPADPRALAAMNQVRRRAGLPDSRATTQTAVREAVYQERRVELAGEFNRWFDLVRTGRLVTRLTAAKGAGSGVPAPANPSERNVVMPIPQRELDANASLTQNPGY
ncbi:RagB/SusD family nutrient uptake outer membrane protein [Rudanella lutea]|uniref:RagB/SusD family nutrient uptake outer membrane protein n=1 Tax=Rudanella lutea TaxID=451374 RepID=UPI0003639C15|nr:RagB/SusD family nutrient uptake outer membrane protein [Rudanella lutea]